MKRIAILHSSPKPTWTSMALIKAFSRLGAEVHYVLWEEFSLNVGSGCTASYRGRCGHFDAILVRGLGRGLTPEQLLHKFNILKGLEYDGVLVVNPAEPLFTARNKPLSLMKLASCGIKVPETTVTENPGTALRAVRSYGKAVIKPLMGSLGLGSYMVKDEDEAYYVVNLLLEFKQPILVQKYLDKRNNRDIRVFTIDGETVAAIYRYSTSSWKTNIARGAKAVKAELSMEQRRLAVEAASCLGLLYAGVDLLETPNGEYYVLEVNASPLWRGLQNATGVDVAAAIARMVLEKVTS